MNKKANPWWFHLHILLQVIGSLCIFASFIVIMIHVKNNGESFLRFGDPVVGFHQLFGFITTGIVFFQIILGIIADRLWRKEFNKTQTTPETSVVDMMHWWFGRFSLLISFVNVYFGLYIFNVELVLWIAFIAWTVLYFVFVVVLEYKKRTAKVNEYELINSQSINSTY